MTLLYELCVYTVRFSELIGLEPDTDTCYRAAVYRWHNSYFFAELQTLRRKTEKSNAQAICGVI